MRTVRYILLVCVGLFLLYAKLISPSTSTPQTPAPVAASAPASSPAATAAPATSADQPVTDASVPAKVLQVLQIVRTTGAPPTGYVGGRVFENREGRLAAGGDYREFDVDPHIGDRNAERIIVDWNTKKAWYTADHYQTFTPLP